MNKNKVLLDELKRLRISTELASVGVWEYDLSTQKIIWSNEVFKLFNRDPSLGEPAFDEYLKYFSLEDQEALNHKLSRAIEFGEQYEIIQTIHHSEEEKTILKGYGTPYFDQSGKVVKLFGTVIDVTKDKGLEEELKNLALVAEKTDNIVVITDTEGKITWVNQGFTKLTEYTLAEVKGRKPGSFLQGKDTDPETVARVKKAIINREPITEEILNYSKSGEPYWLHMNIQPVFNTKGELIRYIALELDLSERKEFEDQIQKYSQELNDALASKNRLFSVIAHDLRAPFQTLIGASKLITEAGNDLSINQIFQLAGDIRDASESTLGLLENLLEWSRSQLGQLTIEKEQVNLKDIVDNSLSSLLLIAKQKNVKVEIKVDNSISFMADKNILQTVLRNLVSNAIKFTAEEGSINIVGVEAEGMIQISVQDTGIGISSENLDKIFDASTISTTRGTKGEPGSGLGLVLVQEFIQKSGGEISVTSELGKGTRFQIDLPQENAMSKKAA